MYFARQPPPPPPPPYLPHRSIQTCSFLLNINWTLISILTSEKRNYPFLPLLSLFTPIAKRNLQISSLFFLLYCFFFVVNDKRYILTPTRLFIYFLLLLLSFFFNSCVWFGVNGFTFRLSFESYLNPLTSNIKEQILLPCPNTVVFL